MCFFCVSKRAYKTHWFWFVKSKLKKKDVCVKNKKNKYKGMKLIDENRELSRGMGQFWGYNAMTIADSDILPWNLSDLAIELQNYIVELQELNCEALNVDLLTDSVMNLTSKLHFVANYLQNLDSVSNEDIPKLYYIFIFCLFIFVLVFVVCWFFFLTWK